MLGVQVEDPETGDGIALVHSLQVQYVHQLVQSRLLDNTRPLHDLYNVLHSFCQSLQLEVLQSQVDFVYRTLISFYLKSTVKFYLTADLCMIIH